jgi:hypothetical protein
MNLIDKGTKFSNIFSIEKRQNLDERIHQIIITFVTYQ